MKTLFQTWAGNCRGEGVERLLHWVPGGVHRCTCRLGVPERPPVRAKESLVSIVLYVTQSQAVSLQVERLSPSWELLSGWWGAPCTPRALLG